MASAVRLSGSRWEGICLEMRMEAATELAAAMEYLLPKIYPSSDDMPGSFGTAETRGSKRLKRKKCP